MGIMSKNIFCRINLVIGSVFFNANIITVILAQDMLFNKVTVVTIYFNFLIYIE